MKKRSATGDYLTSTEVAYRLRTTQKKVYDLVAKGRIPATRVSGKWLFPRQLVDRWLEDHTTYPDEGLLGSLLDRMIVMQGSDDWLLGRVIDRYFAIRGVPVVSANIGSLAGLAAIASGKAHVAGCHVGNDDVGRVACRSDGCHLVNLYEREQGLIFDGTRNPGLEDLGDVVRKRLRFADRQPLSGTAKLVERLLSEQGLSLEGVERIGPFSEHTALALAVRAGRADVGVGIKVAADMCGLDFAPLRTEPYKLAIPDRLSQNPRMAGFVDFVLGEIDSQSKLHLGGYEFHDLGRMEALQQTQEGA